MDFEREPLKGRPYTPSGGKTDKRRSRTRSRLKADLEEGRSQQALASPKKNQSRRLAIGVLLVALLVGNVLHIGSQVQMVSFEVQPETATVQIDGKHLAFKNRFLLWQDTYTAHARAEGYQTVHREFEVSPQASRVIRIELEPLPGELLVRTQPQTEGAVWLDDQRVGKTGEVIGALSSGDYRLQVKAPGFQPHEQRVKIEGSGQRTELEIQLSAQAEEPPAEAEKPEEVSASVDFQVTSEPTDADVLVNGEWVGRTPYRAARKAEENLEIVVLSPGYTPDRQIVTLKPGQYTHEVRLQMRMGLVDFKLQPANATLRINGQVELRRQLRLPQRAHTIEVSAPGHTTKEYEVVPHPDEPQLLVATLTSQAQVQHMQRQQYERDQGWTFLVFRPYDSLELVTTRRRIPIRLTRSFAVMDKEVTNAQYRLYQAEHNSGAFQGNSLDRDSQPVVQVTWEDAALFANWSSQQAGLKPFYRVRDNRIVGFDARSTGYRLPTEAEWLWLTRAPGRFAWGDAIVPPNRFVNVADASASGILQDVIADYNDGAEVSAPVGSFRPSARELYDLPGNVAEWMHDVFLSKLRLYAGQEEERVNPLGEAQGRHHVIRGFSWRDSSQKKLSLKNRRYDREAQDDVGFRLAYYVEAP